MCGIVGGVSQRDIENVLIEALRRLEYRGYDSAGIAVIDEAQRLKRVRVQGKVQTLADAVKETSLAGQVGIAHTRWATHGKPSESNAHPHLSHGELALVHNGIIENHDSLRDELKAKGYEFLSETDTEVAAHLIHYYFQQHNDLLLALQEAALKMHGAFALAVIHQKCPDEVVAIRKGSPLVVGIGVGEFFVASDELALRSFAQSISYLEEGDSVRLRPQGIEWCDAKGKPVKRKQNPLTYDGQSMGKGTYRHFMLKEIYEQVAVLNETLEGRVSSLDAVKAAFGEMAESIFPNVRHIHIVACGTSYHAGLVARYWIETLTRISTQVEVASEYRYRDVVVNDNTLFICVSQSGETADTLGALYKAESLNYLTRLTICNVPTSTMVREADCAFLTRAGTEIGVASTKAFSTQLAAFLMLATALCRDERAQTVLEQLQELPTLCAEALTMSAQIESLSHLFINKAHALFLGRGPHYPVALEGALKLKEISYIHAEAYPAGELKHGPLALVDHAMPVIAIAPNDDLLDKIKSNLHEVSARGGKLIVFMDKASQWQSNGELFIPMPHCGQWVSPIVYTIPLQLLAYYVAVAKGTDVDQPRNLAKSVTVE